MSIFSYLTCIRGTRMVWLADDEISLMLCLAVSTQYRRLTDGQQKDGQTADILRQHSTCCAYASCGKKIIKCTHRKAGRRRENDGTVRRRRGGTSVCGEDRWRRVAAWSMALEAERARSMRVAGCSVMARVLERQRDQNSSNGAAKPTIRRHYCRWRKVELQ